LKTKFYLTLLLATCALANNVVGQSAGDYKSNGTGGGVWNNAATWLTYNGTEYAAASVAPANGTQISIQAGDTVIINSAEILSRVIVDSSAAVLIASGKTTTLDGAVLINGVLSVNGTLICGAHVIAGNGSFSLNAGATLNIGSSGGISASGATGNIQTTLRLFNAAANYTYTGTAAQVTGTGLPANITGMVLNNNAHTVMGLSLSQNISLKSPGSFIVPAARVLTCKAATAITGSGNFLLNSGATLFIGHAAGISAAPATGCIQVTGTRLFSPDANYVYNATTGQSIGNALPSPLTGTLSIANTNATGCVLSSNLVVNTPGRVMVTGSLACAAYTITGTGTFSLNAGATLLTAHALGISAAGSSGSIQTAGINYSANATYVYNGTVAQTTGTGLPAAVAGLSVSNTNMAGVKLTSDISITNMLTLGGGTLCLNGYNLTVATGKTITRQGGTISLCSGKLLYAGPINLTYSGSGNITSGVEMTTAGGLLNTLTIALSAGKLVTLGENVVVNGTVTMTSGSLALGGKTLTYAPNASLFYNGTAAQIVGEEWPDSAFNVDVNIRNTYTAAGVVLNANKKAFTGTLTVRSGGFFNSGAFLLTGSGSITVSAGGTFITRHAAGVSPEGAIQLNGTRTFAAGSSYTFNGTVVQETGREMPSSVALLTINNTAANPVVILSNAGTGTQTITGNLALYSGIFDLNINGMNLLFHTTNTPISRTAGSIRLSRASSLQFGMAGRTGGAPFTLPDNVFTSESPELNNLTLNRANPLTLGNQHLTLNGTLTLTAGILNLANTTLTFQNSPVPVQVGSGSVTAGAGASLQFGTAGNKEGAAFTIPNTFFTTPPTFANLTVNRSNSLTLGTQNITLAGSLNLVSGSLHIGASTLQLDGSITVASGAWHGGPESGLIVGGTGSSLALPSVVGGLKTLTVARPNSGTTPAVVLNADLTLDSLLDLSAGSLGLWKSNLILPAAATILNADEHHYIVTDNNATTGGTLIRPVAAKPVHFPIGTATYTPAFVSTAAGTPQPFRVRVFDSVLSGGTSGAPHQNGTNAVNKTWVFEKVRSDSADATITLQWNAADEAAGFNRAISYISNYKKTGWDTSDASGAQELGAGMYRQTWSGSLQHAVFSVQKEKAALVSWLTFGAVKNGAEVDLQWRAGNARGDRQFDVERSLNKVSFQTIGSVTSTSTESTVDYFFTDKTPVLYQTSYYRLKQVGLDGQINYSDTVKVTADRVDGSIAYPVPVQDNVHIALHAKLGGWAVAYLTDATGKLVKKQPVYLRRGSNIVTVPMRELLKGVYLLQVIADGTMYNVHKIMK
jgi:hypothetical protein